MKQEHSLQEASKEACAAHRTAEEANTKDGTKQVHTNESGSVEY
jgi:hypothetical protein